jgi:hypothetical protein
MDPYTARSAREMRKMNKEKNSIEMKPTVGFKLPWAGLSPAPSEKKMRPNGLLEMVRG